MDLPPVDIVPGNFESNEKDIEETEIIEMSEEKESTPTTQKMKTQKIEEDKNLKCELCDKSFEYRASLSNHMRVHKGKMNVYLIS